jgi:hypothetical protein
MTGELQKREPGELSVLQVIERLAINPEVSIDKIERLIAMQEHIMEREAEIAFEAAMARVQARMPRIDKRGLINAPGKDGKAGHRTPYALLEDVDTGLRPLLMEEGFSVSFSSEPAAGGTIWRCIVGHQAGHSKIFSTPVLPADQTGSKNAVQAIFSASTYARRYCLCLAFNIITTGADDDAKATGFLNDEQIMKVTDALNTLGFVKGHPRLSSFLDFAEADAVSHIQQHRFSACMAMLNKLVAKQEGR